MVDLNKKTIGISAVVLAVLIVAFFLISQSIGKTDDWQYSHFSIQNYLVLGGIVVGALLIAWIIASIFLIVKGKSLIDASGVSQTNPKRVMGILLLAGPVVVTLLSFMIFFIAISSRFEILLVLIPVLILAFIIWLIVYAIKKKMKIAAVVIAIVILLILVVGGIVGLGFTRSQFSSISSTSASLESARIGFAVGGTKDVSNFRKNIENDYLPLSTDITYEGLFFEYFFDTGEKEVCQKLFCPSYNYAISEDPFSEEEDYYLSVGLNSGIKESDFQRKKLNLVVVLDISGSMSSPFSKYYYDQFGQRTPIEVEEDEDADKSKMEIASESVVALLDHLNEDDRFGMVLFDNSDYLAKPLRAVGDTDMNAIKGHILELTPRGGTNFEAGYKGGTELFEEFLDVDPEQYENRIIFLTDAMPNIGSISEEGLLGMTQANADNKIYSTFIGIGVDFNTELIDFITKIRGANYYSVHSGKEFKTRMDDEFEYMVTPLVFNLLMKLVAQGYDIEKVYGSPEANEATGEIMKVNTLFPSKREEEQTKGGIIVLKLKKLSPDASLKLSVSYEDRQGNVDSDEANVLIEERQPDYYENNGIRKGILLSRYADLAKNWINDERESYEAKKPVQPTITLETGIVVPEEPLEPQLGRWERQSIPLQVSNEYKQLFNQFKDYFEQETSAIGDSTLSKEVEILNKLSIYASS